MKKLNDLKLDMVVAGSNFIVNADQVEFNDFDFSGEPVYEIREEYLMYPMI